MQPLEVLEFEGLGGPQAASRRNDIPYHLSTQSRGLGTAGAYYGTKNLFFPHKVGTVLDKGNLRERDRATRFLPAFFRYGNINNPPFIFNVGNLF